MGITVSGLGSGLDIEGLVTQLVAAERAGTDLRYARQQSEVESNLSAFGTLKSALSSFQGSFSKLTNIGGYHQRTISSSASSSIGVSVTKNAAAGNYDIDVTALAERHALASDAFADQDTTALGSGTITIRFGTTDYDSGTDTYNSFNLDPDSETLSIDIDSTNNTLEGIRDAINEADGAVTAAIIYDGSGYRLLLSADDTGAISSLEVAVSDTGDLNDTDNLGLSRFIFNQNNTHLTQTVEGTDAQMTVNGLAVTSASNKVTEVLEGVTLELKEVTESTVKIAVARDLNSIKSNILGLIGGYNKLNQTNKALTSFDAETGKSGQLQGDFTIRTITSQLSNYLFSEVSGFDGPYKSLAEVGIITNSDGVLEMDLEKMDEILAANPDDLIGLFAALGDTGNEDVAYTGSSVSTLAGDYPVNVTQLATQATYTGAGVLPDFGGGGSLIIDSDNDQFTVVIDEVDSEGITLTAGTYTTGDDLAAEIQAAINGADNIKESSASVEVTYDSGSNSFSIVSVSYGTVSTVEITSVDTNVAADLGFSVAVASAGLDVEGTIDGAPATGVGQLLTAGEDTDANGLELTISGSTTGDLGTISYSRGIADQLGSWLEELLDSEEGLVESRLDALNTRMDRIEDSWDVLDLRMEKVEARYRKEFIRLDLLMSNMTATSNFLTTELSNLAKLGSYSIDRR